MTAMHKLLLSRIQASKMARLHLGRTPVQKEGMQAVALDIQNAFSSIPREEILHGLDEAHVPLVLRNYVEASLQMRHAAHLDSVPCGAR